MGSSRPPSVWFGMLAVIAAAVIPFSRTPSFPYHWTDHAEIEEGALVPRNIHELGRFLTLPKGVARSIEREKYSASHQSGAGRFTYFRPVKVLSYGLDYALSGGQPWSFHLSNLAFHVAASCLLLLLGRKLWGEQLPWLAEALALFHAASPLQVEAVCWISARSDSLWGLFLLLSLYFLLRARATHSGLYRVLSGFAALLSMASKESGLAVVPIDLIVSWLISDSLQPIPWRRAVKESLAPLMAAVVYLAYRFLVIQDIQFGALGSAPGPGAWTLLHLFGLNLFQSLVPVALRLADTIEIQAGPTMLGVSGAALFATWLALGIRFRQQAPFLLLGALCWLLSILPVSQIVPIMQPRGERYLYVPSMFAGMSLLWLAWTSVALLRRFRWTVATAAVLVWISLAFGAYTRASLWSDERLLFSNAVEEQPQCTECWNNLAYAEAVSGNLKGAVKACSAALKVDRRRYWTHLDSFSVRWILARALLLLQEGPQAARWLEEIVARAGATPSSLQMLAEAYLIANRPGHALAVIEQALRLAPRDAGLENLARAAARAEAGADYPSFELPVACLPP